MMFFSRKKNKWQDKSPAVRLQAIEEMTPANSSVLAELATSDDDAEVRLAAAKRLDDLFLLDSVYDAASDVTLRQFVASKREKLRLQILQKDGDEENHKEQLAKIENEQTLIEAAAKAFFLPIRLIALDRIKDAASLERLATLQCGKTVSETLLSRLEDADVLQRLSTSGGNKIIKRLASEKLSHLQELERQEPAVAESELRDIIENAKRLSSSVNWELARQRFTELSSRWQALCPQDDHNLKGEFDDAWTTFEQRYEEHLAQQQATLLQEEENKRSRRDLDAILEQIDESTPASLEGLLDPWAGVTVRFEELLQTLGDDTKEYKNRFDEALRSFEEKVQIWRKESEHLNELSNLFQSIAKSAEDTPKKVAALNELSKTIGSTKWSFADAAPLRQEMAAALQELGEKNEKERLAYEEQKNMARRNAWQIIEELASLYELNDMHEAVKRFSILEEAWQALSHELRSVDDLATAYKKKRARFLVRQRDFFTLEEWRRWANGTIKARLVEEVKNLDHTAELDQVFEGLKRLQARWKEIGAAAGKTNTILWQRFREQCQRQFERCKPYLEQQGELRQQQTVDLQIIVEEAEALVLSEDWGGTSQKIGSLQKQFEELSLVPFKIRQEFLTRFRKAKNTFFERRRLALQEQAKLREQNLTQKITLCEQAEKLSAEPETARPADYKKLQKEWKKIGPASRKEEQKIWARFRMACDTYFAWLDEQRNENIRQKQLLVTAAQEVVKAAEDATDFRPLSQKIIELQEGWKAIGPVPNEARESIWQEFRQHCDRFFAIRQESLDAILQEQLENQRQKENIIDRIEQLAVNLDDKQTSEQIKTLQKDFFSIGPAARGREQQLRQQLKTLCNNYFEGRSRYFTNLRDIKHELLKEKEALLFELERLVGVPSGHKRRQQPQALDLAAQLKLALESNFAMADRSSNAAVREEINRIQRQWKGLDPLPYKLENSLQQRFEEALDFFERSAKNKTSK